MAHHSEPDETKVTAQAHDGHKAVDPAEEGGHEDGVATETPGVEDRAGEDVPGDDVGGEIPADEKQGDKQEGDHGPNGQAPDPTKMAPSPAQGVKSVLKSGIFGGSPKSSPGKPSAKTQTPGVSAPTRALSASTSRGPTAARPGTAPRTVPPSPKVASAPTRLRATGTAAAPARARVSLAPPPKPRSTTATATASGGRLKEPFKPTSTRPAGPTKAAAATQSVNGTAANVTSDASGASSPSIAPGISPAVTGSRARASLAPAPASTKATRPTSRVIGTPSTSTSGAKTAVPRPGGPSVTTTNNVTGVRPRASVAPTRPGVAAGPRLASSRSSVDKANGSAEMKAQIELLQSQLETEQREHEAKLAEMAAERAEVEKSALELAQLDKTSGPSDRGQKEIDEIKALHEAERGQDQQALSKALDECASLIRERDALQAAVESNKQVLVLTETKLSETTSSLAAAQGHIAELKDTVAENAATIESTSAAQRELEERVRLMKVEFERIGDGREVLEYENNRLERQLRELTEAKELDRAARAGELEARDELKEARDELEKVKAEFRRSEEESEKRREESGDAEQNLVEELDLARNETELAEAETDRVRSELESLSARLATRESEGDAWKAEREVSTMSCFAIMLMNVVYIRELEKLRGEAESLAAESSEKDRVYKDINAQYESLREAHDGLTSTHATLVQMHAGQEDTLGNLNSEVSSLRAEIGELKSQLKQKTRDGEMVEKEKIALSTRVEDLQGQLAAAADSGLVELEQKLKCVQEERDGLVAERDSALAEMEALKAEATVDKGRMEELEQKSQQLGGRVKELEGELEIKIAEGATLGERLEAIKADAARQAQDLESKVVELGSRAEAAEAKVEAAEQQLHASSSRAELEQKTLELENQLADATSARDHLTQAAEIERSNIDALRVEHAREVESLAETASSLKSQLERLADEHHKALDTMSAEHEQSLLQLKDELAARAAEGDAAELAQLDAKRDLEAATGDVERVRAELARVNGELESARTGSEERDDLVQRLADMEERSAKGAEEAQRLEGELQEVKSLKLHLELQVTSAKETSTAAAREREALEGELKQRDEQRAALLDRVEGLTRDLEEVTKKLDSTTSELEDARQATKSGEGEEVALRQALEDVKEELDMTKSVLEMNKSHFAEQLDHSAKQYSSAIDRLNGQSTSLLEGKQAAEAVIAQMTAEVNRLKRDLEDERAARNLAAAKLSARTPPMSPPSDTTSPSSITKLHEAHNAKVAELETTIRKLAGELDGKHVDGLDEETF